MVEGFFRSFSSLPRSVYNKFTKLKPREYLIDLKSLSWNGFCSVHKLTHRLVTCFANFAGSDIKLGTGALHDNFAAVPMSYT